jgi:hypothetical protein
MIWIEFDSFLFISYTCIDREREEEEEDKSELLLIMQVCMYEYNTLGLNVD